MNILITGGCGYVGTMLTNQLLEKNHNVTVVDVQWFGNYLKEHKNLDIIKCDIRNIQNLNFRKFLLILLKNHIKKYPKRRITNEFQKSARYNLFFGVETSPFTHT